MTVHPNYSALLQRALTLAAAHLGRVEPNPPVGCVLAVPDAGGWRAIGEGAHERFGGPHAEVNALADARRREPDSLPGSTAFVTLEPCNHTGQTGPCTEAFIAAGVARVVAATADPAPHTAGAGFARLRDAGLEVTVGACEAEAKRLIAPFAKLITTGRPWVHAKWAMTLDGKLATRTGHSQWITGEAARAVVHELRGRVDAIAVGIGTVRADDPLLTARPPGPRTATRVVIDPRGTLAPDTRLAETAADTPVLRFVTAPDVADIPHVETVYLEPDGETFPFAAFLDELGRRRMTHVLVEGGSHVLGGLFDAGLVDEAHAFVAPKLVGGTDAPSPIAGLGRDTVPEFASLKEMTTQTLGDDLYIHGYI